MFFDERYGKSNFGFTLAEVLITLGIIGVVAALTIPNLVASYQKKVTVTRLQKAYSAIANTINPAVLDNGPINTWDISKSNNAQASLDFTNTYLLPYLHVSKNCGIDTTGICAFKYSCLNRKNSYSYLYNYARFYLSDGTFVAVETLYNPSRSFVEVFIDINGQKKPNILGKDIFRFRYELFNAQFYPTDFWAYTRDGALNASVNGCNKNANGTFCATVIMKDGWEIKDDYPW